MHKLILGNLLLINQSNMFRPSIEAIIREFEILGSYKAFVLIC